MGCAQVSGGHVDLAEYCAAPTLALMQARDSCSGTRMPRAGSGLDPEAVRIYLSLGTVPTRTWTPPPSGPTRWPPNRARSLR